MGRLRGPRRGDPEGGRAGGSRREGEGRPPPFHPKKAEQHDPGAGFLTIPREVAVGLGEAVKRWGAIDFGVESGDVMHFDDKGGLATPFYAAAETATDKIIEADQKAKEEAEKAKAAADAAKAAGQGGGSGPTPAPSPAPPPASSPAAGVQRTVQRQAVASPRRAPTVQRQPPAAPPGPAAPGHRPGEAWPFGPTSQFKSITVDLATFVGWVREAETAYGVDKEAALQRLRRIYYSTYSGKAGTKFDRVIEAEQGGHEPPLDVRIMSPRRRRRTVRDGCGRHARPPGGRRGPHPCRARPRGLGRELPAGVGEAAYDVKMAGVVTWTGDLASWFLEWTQEVKKIHSTPPPPPTGPATDEGPPSEVGGDPAMDPALWERIGASKASKDDLLGDIDAQIMTASSVQPTTAESRKRENRWAERELSAPVSALLEQYYGLAGGSAAGGTPARTSPDADRFPAFVRLAVPPIPHDEVNGKVSLACRRRGRHPRRDHERGPDVPGAGHQRVRA